eukprot:SAG31_NODE_298_length_18125_cov_27.373350_17_plen_42_part_00
MCSFLEGAENVEGDASFNTVVGTQHSYNLLAVVRNFGLGEL